MQRALTAIAALTLLTIPCLAGQALADETLQSVEKAGSRAALKGGAATFTGSVRVDMLSDPHPEAPYSVAYVTFEPGARTHWHTHPAGQTLVIVAGVGLTGTEDGRVWEIRPGDVVWCPEGVRHWHGAAPTTAMTHLCVTGDRDGRNVTWMEPVSDEQYRKGQK